MKFDIPGFRAIDVIGKGGFGVVHRAEDQAHGREVAVKVLAPIDDESARRRFDRERRAMGALSGHPNIVIVYTSGFTERFQPYMVMELVRGGSLADRLENDGPLGVDEVAEIGMTLAETLQVAHDAGVLHLDLKPENILMSRFGRPKIVDFGIAALVDDESRTATIRATPSYADPKVLQGKPGTEQSDVYGLAATMFTLLEREPPYSQGPSGLYQIMTRVIDDPVPAVSRSDASTHLVECLQRAMAKDPADRPQTMMDFADELRAAIAAAESADATRPRPAVRREPEPEPQPDPQPEPEPARPPVRNRGLPKTATEGHFGVNDSPGRGVGRPPLPAAQPSTPSTPQRQPLPRNPTPQHAQQQPQHAAQPQHAQQAAQLRHQQSQAQHYAQAQAQQQFAQAQPPPQLQQHQAPHQAVQRPDARSFAGHGVAPANFVAQPPKRKGIMRSVLVLSILAVLLAIILAVLVVQNRDSGALATMVDTVANLLAVQIASTGSG